MHVRFIAGLGTMFLLFGAPEGASAGVWVWGCQGKFGDQQVAYNRYFLSVVPANVKLGGLREIIDRTNIVENGDPASTYQLAEGGGDAFGPVMKFERHDDPSHAVVLTQKSSKKISSRKRM